MDLANDLKSGALSALLVVGEDGVLGQGGTTTLPIDKLEALIVVACHRDVLTSTATVALPMAAWAEVEGTFTNRAGMVQRVRAAVPPAGDSLPAWEIVALLSDRMGLPMDFISEDGKSRNPTARAVFQEAKRKMPFMKDADWGRVSLPIQLRFANSRG